jgi:ABC-type branched-subunit amino acid transport system substrate-binding protein
MRTFKIITLSILAIILPFLVKGTPQAASQDNVSNSSGAKKTFTVGMIVPLSGPLAFFGQDYMRAYELAVAKRPELANLLSVRWEDSAYNPRQAISAFNKLLLVDNADLIYSFGGPMLNALAPLAEARKVPFYASESEKGDCEGRKFCVLFRNERREWGEATWYALRKRGFKNLAIVKNQNQFMNSFVNGIIETKRTDESVSILIDAPPGTTDLRTEVLKLRDAKFDALGVYLLPDSHHGFINALRSIPKKPFLFGVEELLHPENNRGNEDLVEGALVIAPWVSPQYQDLFESKHGSSAGFFYTAAFYDFLNLVADTVKANSAARGLNLISLMRFPGTRTGVSGEYFVKVSDTGVTSYSFPIGIYRQGSPVVQDDVFHATR